MPTSEELYQKQFEKDRARQTQGAEQDKDKQAKQAKSVPFPWSMLCLAAFFDLIGLIPVVNLISESLAGLIFGLWQKTYAPMTDPLTTFVIAKTADAISLGALPSNIGIVVYAYLKRKAANLAPYRL